MGFFDGLSKLFSDEDVISGLITAGGSLAGQLFANDVNQEQFETTNAFNQQQLQQQNDLAMAQIAASQANAGLAASTAKEIAKKQIAAKMAGDYGSLISRSSLARAEALKDKDVQIPQSISSMFGRVQQSLGR